jgi:hypothetical protein
VEIGDGRDTIKTSLPITLDAGTGHTSYLWQNNSVGNTIVATQWNLYWVMVTDEHGCTARDSVYVHSPHHINDLELFPGTVKIYPNPVLDILHLEVEMDAGKHVILEMFNLLDILIYKEDLKEIQLIEKEMSGG